MTPRREMDEERFLEKWRKLFCYPEQEFEKDLRALRKSWERKAEAKGMREIGEWLIRQSGIHRSEAQRDWFELTYREILKKADAIEGGRE